MGEGKLQHSVTTGTLAIDLGSTTTVVAFTPIGQTQSDLLDLPPISRRPGEVPSLVWETDDSLRLGQDVLDAAGLDRDSPHLAADFKRQIGSSNDDGRAARAGQLLLEGIWARLPDTLHIQRLVLTAPVETYRDYRRWLLNACETLPVEEIALVDEPTAAALGAGFAPGSRLLVVDLGGSTLDLALVALQGEKVALPPSPNFSDWEVASWGMAAVNGCDTPRFSAKRGCSLAAGTLTAGSSTTFALG